MDTAGQCLGEQLSREITNLADGFPSGGLAKFERISLLDSGLLSDGIGSLTRLFQSTHSSFSSTSSFPRDAGRVQLIREIRTELTMHKVQICQSIRDFSN